ncbi:STP1 protein, partial [Plasmodium ovale]
PLPEFHSLPTEESEKSGVSQKTPLTQPTSAQTEIKTATTPNRNPPGDPVAPTAIVPQFQPPRSLESVIKARNSYTSSNPTLTSDPTIHVDSSPPVTKGQDGATYSIPRMNSITSTTTHSSQYVSTSLTPDLSLSQLTTTTTTIAPVTISTMNTTQASIQPTQQVPSVSGSQEPFPSLAAGEPKATVPITVELILKEFQFQHNQIKVLTIFYFYIHIFVLHKKNENILCKNLDSNYNIYLFTKVTIDNNQQTTLSSEPSPKTKDSMKHPEVQSANSLTPHSAYTPSGNEDIQGVKIPKTVGKTNTKHNISAVKIGNKKDHDQSTQLVSVNQGKISLVKPGKDPKNNPVTQKGKNDNPNIISEGIPPLMHIIPTFLITLETITLLFQLYKYTPFGFLLGRRRKRKKHDLRRILEIPQKHTYESPNIALHEWEYHNLVGQTKGNDAYIKLLKINRYKQEMQKRKKKNKTTLIEVHMEVLEEYKNDEWELHKGDFLEMCLRRFINEENDNYSKLPNTELTVKSTKNDKIIEDIQKQEILWNNWIENHRNILEQWKEKEWFHILKNKWRNEEQKYKEENNKLRENILNEQETHSIVSQKDIWKQWISKQATLIDMFNKEDWFKSMLYAQNKEKNNYHINEYNNISVTSKTGLKNEKMNPEQGRSKNIIQKLMVQIHMMVLEECIKEDIIKHKELCIDNFIEDIHNQNNYDEKRNITQCDTEDFSVPEYEEIHTSKNK